MIDAFLLFQIGENTFSFIINKAELDTSIAQISATCPHENWSQMLKKYLYRG